MNEINEFVANRLWEIITSEDNVEKKIQLLIEAVSEFFRVDKCSLMVEKDGILKIVASVGIARKVIQDAQVKLGEGISGMAVKERKAIFIRKVNVSNQRELWSDYKTDNFISYPVEYKGNIIGVLNLTDKRDDRSFSEKDIERIEPIVRRIGYVLKDLIKV